ncbi:hypothetical protein DPMN_075851 [Dreissena polymorpha]|uniref:Uncharacterized protein n=1 Tax=Dreissena polymorpha TaxID=45954 RepID=A0A9D3YKE2_DREPO|nr:hypothetical protein DPMN_075851 [Dreissena polymorpha]
MKTAATLAAMFFNKPQAINTTNLRTKFHEDWTINVTSRVLTSKAAPPPGSHVFQQTDTTFKLSLAIIKTNAQTKFHEDLTINVTPRVLTNKTALPPGGHKINVLTKFHEDWTKNVTSRAFKCFQYIHIEKTAPPPGGHVFSPIWTIFELVRDINETNVLTKFHDDWAKIVTSRVFTRNTAPPPGGHVFQWTIKTNILTKLHEDWASHVTSTVFTSFELGRGIIGTNVLTKFHEDRTINVASRVFTRQMLTTDAQRTTDKR